MNTPKHLQVDSYNLFKCEIDVCPFCGSRMKLSKNISGRKIIQTLKAVLRIGYRPGYCSHPECPGHTMKWRAAEWQQLAPLHCRYGFDVIAQIGWLRHEGKRTFEEIHEALSAQVVISEAQVRHLYYTRYLPLMACVLRSQWNELERLSSEGGLVLTLDGLAPEGGEPQLWIVRELKSGLPLLSGWLSEQKQVTFEEFLQPIADEFRVRDLKISGIMSDKQQGLPKAIEKVFPGIPHSYCQAHYLKNIAEPISEADSDMKVSFRKQVRETVGELLRHEETENQGVLTVTGLIPSPIKTNLNFDLENASSIHVDIALNSSEQYENVSSIQPERALNSSKTVPEAEVKLVDAACRKEIAEVETSVELDTKSRTVQATDETSMVVATSSNESITQKRDDIVKKIAEVETSVELGTKSQTVQATDETSTVVATSSNESIAQKRDDIVKACRKEIAEVETSIELDTKSRTDQAIDETSTVGTQESNESIVQKRDDIVKKIAEVETSVELDTKSRTDQATDETFTVGTQESKESIAQKRDDIVKALLRRTRYLLTLKGRPPFRLAGIEMYERMTELADELDDFIKIEPEPRLVFLQQGLRTTLSSFADEYRLLCQGREYLQNVSALLDDEASLPRTGEQVKQQLWAYLTQLIIEVPVSSPAAEWVEKMTETTLSYEAGLFHTYDVDELPKTNNDRESEFREYKRRLLRTTGQVGVSRRLIARCGAWELLIPPLDPYETSDHIACIEPTAFEEERERVRQHRERFRLHTRATKFFNVQIRKLKKIWQDLTHSEAESSA